MNDMSIDIELIVREVLAQLAAAPASVASKSACSERPATAVAGAVPPGPATSLPSQVGSQQSAVGSTAATNDQQSTLTVASRVVTMNDVAGRLDSIRRVVVSRQAIVTPAVRDELLRRGIALEQADSLKDRPAVVRLALVTARTKFDPTSLVAALAREGFQVERSASDCLIAAVDALAGEVAKPGTLGVLVTPHAAAGVCLANRLSGVRAVAGVDAPGVAAASAAVGANLLVADPRTGTFFQLKQTITEFARGGVRSCPDVFRKRLA
jgi:hypothetical protein